MKQALTDKLLSELNALKGVTYPQKGYTYFANIVGDGRNHRTVYVIINDQGGVTTSNLFNRSNSRSRCQAIRAAIADAKH